MSNHEGSSWVVVEWRSVVGPTFNRFAIDQAKEFYRDGLFVLRPSGTVKFSVESNRRPQKIIQQALIYSDSTKRRLLYAAIVPAYAFDSIEPFKGKF
jgi:hypothetical protein